MDSGGSTPPRGREKKRRVQAACEACRTRKLACDAQNPCSRCAHDQRPCEYVERRPREVLSKARVQELEDVIRLQSEMWDAVMPEYPMRMARAVAEGCGVGVAAAQARQVLAEKTPSTAANILIESPTIPVAVSLAKPFNGLGTTIEASSIDLSRPPSFTDLGRPPQTPFEEPGGYEWSEDGHPDTTTLHPAADAHRAASYLGLSSGATFLRAVQRLAAQGDEGLLRAYDEGTVEIGHELKLSTALAPLGAAPLIGIPQSRVDERQANLPRWSDIKGHVDSFFKQFHRNLTLVHEPTIRAQLTGAIPFPSKPGSAMLVHMIVAMGAFESATNDTQAGHSYFLEARRELQRDMFGKGSLPLVQGLAIMSNYLQHGNHPEDGYMCLGWACRMALAIGLHIEPRGDAMSPLEKEIRIRTWWSLIAMEAGCSITFGRPPAFSAATIGSLPLPLNIDDDDLTVSSTTTPPSTEAITLHTALILQALLAKATSAVQDHLAARAHTPPDAHELRVLERHVTEAWEATPKAWRDWRKGECMYHRAIQYWRVNDFRALLYRPLLLAAAWDGKSAAELGGEEREAIDTCRALALDNLQDITAFVAQAEHCRATEWYSMFFAFQSSLTLLLALVWEPSHANAAEWRGAVGATASWFRQVKTMRRTGLSYASAIERVLELAAVARTKRTRSPKALLATHHALNPHTQILGPVEEDGAAVGCADGMPVEFAADPMDLQRYWSEIWGDAASDLGFSPFMMDMDGWEMVNEGQYQCVL